MIKETRTLGREITTYELKSVLRTMREQHIDYIEHVDDEYANTLLLAALASALTTLPHTSLRALEDLNHPAYLSAAQSIATAAYLYADRTDYSIATAVNAGADIAMMLF